VFGVVSASSCSSLLFVYLDVMMGGMGGAMRCGCCLGAAVVPVCVRAGAVVAMAQSEVVVLLAL